jgi:hypothetical protein
MIDKLNYAKLISLKRQLALLSIELVNAFYAGKGNSCMISIHKQLEEIRNQISAERQKMLASLW